MKGWFSELFSDKNWLFGVCVNTVIAFFVGVFISVLFYVMRCSHDK